MHQYQPVPDNGVILIDADMRKGYVHKLFNINSKLGLSDAITHKINLEEAIHTVQLNETTMDIICRGELPPNPSELLMHENFASILKVLSKKYDLVIIDSPPIHAVTDPTIIGKHAGVVFYGSVFRQAFRKGNWSCHKSFITN